MRFVRTFVLLLAAVALVSPAVMAQDESKFKISLAFVEAAPTASDGFFGIEPQSGSGGELAFEFHVAEKMGIELAVGQVSHDVEDAFGLISGEGVKIAEISQTPLFLNLNFHLVNSERMDFWLGGGLAVTTWDDLELEPGVASASAVDVKTQADWGIGLNAGLDIRFGKRFALVLGARYYEAEVRVDDPDFDTTFFPVSVDPVAGRVGVSFRF